QTNNANTIKPKLASESVVSNLNRDRVIIEDWYSDDEEVVSEVQTVRPETQIVRPKTQTVKTIDDKSSQNSKKQGIGFRKVKACFVCKSIDHLIKDCNFYDKKSQESNLKNVVNTGETFVLLGVLTRTGLHRPSISTVRPSINTVRPSISTASLSINTVRPSVSTARPIISTARPVYASRPIYPRMDNVWRPKEKYLDHVSKDSGSFILKKGNPKILLQDHAVVDSGCSSHMTGNKAYLLDYEDFNGGFVAFGSDPKGESINKKRYCLVVTDDFSRFSWVFFLATKDETFDNGTEFKNYDMNEFCAKKGIKREFSVARTPQQNGVVERKNRTLIEAARTMLANSLLPIPFWAEAVNTACYVLNKVLVTKPQNKTPYELLIGKSPSISFMRPFGCPLTILNILDSLGKFDGKSDEGYLLGYSTSSKAFRVYNKRTKMVEENLHINFLEDQPNVAGTGPNWMFDLDFLTNSMNYVPISVENQVNVDAGTQDYYVAGSSRKDKGPTQEYILLPLQPHRTRFPVKDVVQDAQEKPSENVSSDKDVQDSEDAADKEEQHQMQENEKDLQDELEIMVTQELAAKAMNDVSRQAFEEEKRKIASQKKAAQTTNIMFAVYACARFQVTPKAFHLHVVKGIFRYLKHQPKLGLWYPMDLPFELEAFSDSDYSGASLDRKSTTGGCQFLADHCCRDCYEKRLIDVLKIHTDSNVADILTKGFDVTRISMDLRLDRCSPGKYYSSIVYKHNMVAFLKKPNESVGFTEVVDFLKGTSLRCNRNTTLSDAEIYDWISHIGGMLLRGYAQGYSPLPACLVGKGTWIQGEGSTQPAEPHHTPVDPILSTSHPHQSPPHSPHQSPPHSPPYSSPHSPHQSPPFSPPQFSPSKSYEAPIPEGNTSGSAEDSMQLKKLMGIVPKVKLLEKELKRKTKKVVVSESEGEEPEAQGRIIQDINDDPLVSLVRESMKMKEKSTDFVTPTKDSGDDQEEDISPTTFEAAKTLSVAKIINIELDVEEEINTGIEEVSTGSAKVDFEQIRQEVSWIGTEAIRLLASSMDEEGFSRDELVELYRLVIKKYGANTPEEMYDRVLWGDLKTMFDPPLSEDAIWSFPLQQKIIN
ncbi:retrovirus-related pol polyprotein from transposon TNT 1-94, partial [Tanacetum coccineum]